MLDVRLSRRFLYSHGFREAAFVNNTAPQDKYTIANANVYIYRDVLPFISSIRPQAGRNDVGDQRCVLVRDGPHQRINMH
jgi:hypothetical protein